jgi:hypothetical protein
LVLSLFHFPSFFLVSLLFSFSFRFCWASQHQCLSFPATAGLVTETQETG